MIILPSKVHLTVMTLVFSVVLAGYVHAQTGTSMITGVVTDQTGAAIPGAAVKIINPLTGFTRSTVSNDEGNYRFPGIPPATYKLEVIAGNFKKTVKRGVRAFVDSTNEANISLEIGEVTATVDVTGDEIESVINRQDASLGNTFVSTQITQLPTLLRNVPDLMSLQPGVTREGFVAGGRSDQANITLDGVDINDQLDGGRPAGEFSTSQGSVLKVTAESVEEFRITTMNANANQGRSSGAQISLITRSGSNEWHGAGYYFYRPTRGSANNFFSNAVGRYEAGDQAVLDGLAEVGEERVPRPILSRGVFGGRIGGPIIKDRAFFFYSYEGQRQNREFSVVRTVPLAHMGQGMLRFTGWLPGEDPDIVPPHSIALDQATLNSIYTQVGINPLAVAMFADAASRYPANDETAGDGVNTGGFRFNSRRTQEQNTHTARVDFNLTDGQQLFIRVNYQWNDNNLSSYFPDTPGSGSWGHPYGWAVGHNWTISSNKVNNFRWGLTRAASSFYGDSSENNIDISGVFSPRASYRTWNNVIETHTFTDDFTWIKGDHSWQFGGTGRFIRHRQNQYQYSFDNASTTFSYYNQGGRVIDDELTNAGYLLASGQNSIFRRAAAALIGRFTRYGVNVNFDTDGSILPAGTASIRNFATEGFDVYLQDIWKPGHNLTITYGLRYELGRPVYEQNGFQLVPSEALGDFFDRRVASSRAGIPLNDLITFQFGGPKNNAPGLYETDWNNFQPRFAVAWSPGFERGFWRKLFGEHGVSTIRGGFAITNDYFGQQLATSFDLSSSIGFTSSVQIPSGIFNVTDNPGPLFTGFDQDIRSFPGISFPVQLFSMPADEAWRIQSSLDATIVSPIHYTWNVSYGRSLPGEMYVEASYIGRKARNLFAARDIMALNNLVDPASGMDWYTAAGMLVDAQKAGVPITSQAAIPYFENLFPNAMAALGIFGLPANNNTQAIYGLFSDDGFGIRDYTLIQLYIDDATRLGLPVNPGIFPNMFLHPQYGAFSSFGTTAYSDYHGGTLSIRQRLGDTLTFDLNYTFSRSMDNASGQRTWSSYGSAFILNSLRPDDAYAASDFDIRHLINANFIFQLPFGIGRKFGSDMNSVLDAVVGGWQLAGVFRWNSGRPFHSPFDRGNWATNWNISSNVTRIGPIPLASGGADRTTQNIFSDPQAAFNNFRNARPGETGERNMFRQPDYHTLDLGLSKSFTMPWGEGHKFQFRWEVFNVMNFQPFAAFGLGNFGVPPDPETSTAPANFGKIYNYTQGSPRSMQFGFRYEF